MLTLDGSRYSGSGTLVRQAVAFAALTGRPIQVVNVRSGRPSPGLRPQHVRAVEAIRELVSGRTGGVRVEAREFTFEPGPVAAGENFRWDIGSAGSTTMLALAVLPVLAFRSGRTEVELHGGLFQDFAPTFFHLQHVLLPLLARMGLAAEVEMVRPGYVPRGGGLLRLRVQPVEGTLRPLVLEEAGRLERLWGLALASHLNERKVSRRIADAAQKVFRRAGRPAEIEIMDDESALQRGAAFAAFGDLAGGVRLGADMAGAPRRTSETIGRQVARQLLREIDSGATLDLYAADQIIPFAALAAGESRFRLAHATNHVASNAWLAGEFLGAEVSVDGQELRIRGARFEPRR